MVKYLFVCDNFLEDYCGGAELSTEALINLNKENITKVKSSKIDDAFISENENKFWIFGNFTQISHNNILKIVKSNIKYSIVEYDLKFCKFRSPEMHRLREHRDCDCHENNHGKLISIFFSNAESLWFMSEKQKEIYENKFNFLKGPNSFVLSSIFDIRTLNKIRNMKEAKNDKWIILNSPSWIKNKEGCIKHAKSNNLSYELVWGIQYTELLLKLSKSKGLIFLPLDKDTCPRIVIEAKMLDCELKINENVLHKDEEWFCGSKEGVFNYLSSNADFFWEKLDEYSF